MSTSAEKKITLVNMRITEKYGLTGNVNIYVKSKEQAKFLRLCFDNPLESNFIYNFCRKVFLPQGYPKTVSEDYFQYQFYDTIQAFASGISGTIATKSVLKSVGVGNAEATPLAAAITWVFKEGTGMFGGILFSWYKGTDLDANNKRWRIFADILNDMSLTIELILPCFNDSHFTVIMLCLTTTMKYVLRVAGSATRAAVTQHQAIAENAADVAAKDASQETAVNLLSSIVSILLLTFFEESRFEWTIFILFTLLHLYANFLAVKSLIFRNLNAERFMIIAESYLRFDYIPSPEAVNRSEPLFFSSNFCGWNIRIGGSFNEVATYTNLQKIINLYEDKKFIAVPLPERKTVAVLLQPGETSSLIIEAYFHALILALGYHIVYDIDLECFSKRTAQNTCLFARLKNDLNKVNENYFELIKNVIKFVESEYPVFLQSLQEKGWKTNVHSIFVEDWRIENLEYTD